MSGQFIAAGTIIVGSVATAIYKAAGNGCVVQISHPSGGKRVTIGTQGVTDQAGWVFKGSSDYTFTMNLPPNVTLWGICEPAQTQSINYIVTEF